ncbi:hypothetical protein [Pseudarthrobacter sp. SSS035]|uniref:hypothetical protein n=1 Tax=Pseudarthrobacter sp. SSS035 TaxID=2931399 RepID=UPI00200D5D07|nr:hypothetical protein [Pseudarthrobacter sp. SSS035]
MLDIQYNEDMFIIDETAMTVALGGIYQLDDRVSWVPAGSTGYQPANCYLLGEGEHRLLVDSGLAIHEQEVIGALTRLLGSAELSIFFTRGEMDCVSNLQSIATSFPLRRLYTGGVTNPFDAFDDIHRMALRSRRQQIDQKGEGGDSMARTPEIEILPGRVLEIESPLLRLLPTFWGWDAASGTIFTSDTFTHGVMDAATDPVVIDDLSTDNTTPAQVRAHLLAKYEWIERASTRQLRDWIADKFDTLQPETIAPSRGRMLRGRDVVKQHVEYLLDALAPADD